MQPLLRGYTVPYIKYFLTWSVLTSVTVCFTIADTGRGISEEFQKEMFEPFTRETTQEAAVSGTGLGLPIVKRLTDMLGGSIPFKAN